MRRGQVEYMEQPRYFHRFCPQIHPSSNFTSCSGSSETQSVSQTAQATRLGDTQHRMPVTQKFDKPFHWYYSQEHCVRQSVNLHPDYVNATHSERGKSNVSTATGEHLTLGIMPGYCMDVCFLSFNYQENAMNTFSLHRGRRVFGVLVFWCLLCQHSAMEHTSTPRRAPGHLLRPP